MPKLPALLLALVTLLVVPSAAAAMTIFVQPVGGTPLTLDVEPSDSIENVKAKVEDQTAFPPASQALRFGSTDLEDGLTLADYNVQKDNTLELRLKADLGVTVSNASPTVTAGGQTSYVVTVTNAGPAPATGTGIAVTVAPALTGTWSCGVTGGATCAGWSADLPAGSTVTYTLAADVAGDATGQVEVQATVTPAPLIVDATEADLVGQDRDDVLPAATPTPTPTPSATPEPAGPAPTPTPAAASPPVAESPTTGPAPASCVSRRRFDVRPELVFDRRLRAATLELRGRRVTATRRAGVLVATVDLRGLPAGRVTVRLTGVTRRGTRVARTLRYRTCVLAVRRGVAKRRGDGRVRGTFPPICAGSSSRSCSPPSPSPAFRSRRPRSATAAASPTR